MSFKNFSTSQSGQGKTTPANTTKAAPAAVTPAGTKKVETAPAPKHKS